MARKAITIEDRMREFCKTANEYEIIRMRDMMNNALLFRFGADDEMPKPKRTRKPKEPQAKLAGVE